MSKSFAVRSGSRQNVQNTRDAIVNRETFKTSGALRGEGDYALYYVFSYAAIIARYTIEEGWIVPTRKYSVTTSNHQSAVRGALAVAGIDYKEPTEF